MIRLRDIGHAVLGARSYDLEGRLNGVPTAFVLLYMRPGANALAVKEAVADAAERAADQLSRRASRAALPFDTTPFVSASIKEVAITLVEAMILVTLVVFLFLQSWRATLIPMLAVPVSVIGTFLGLLAFGMSINVLTLFGLVLAIGIVVDDAIVVIENVERIMASGEARRRGSPPTRRFARSASALVAIVLVLCSVFVPVAFIGGVTGELFKQFAMTIVIAVVLSGIVALTLTPALCALLLKESDETHTTGFFGWFNRLFARATNGLRRRGRFGDPAARRSGSPSFSVIVGLAGVFWRRIPTAFIPTEDKGYMALSVQLPDAASLQRTEATVASHRKDPARRAGGDEHRRARRSRSSDAVERDERRDDLPQREAVGRALAARRARLDRRRASTASCSRMRDANAFGFNLPEVPGLGITAGVEINLQNRNGQDIRTFAQHVHEFRQAVNQLPAAGALNTTFRANVPQVYVTVDRTAAKARGVNLTDLFAHAPGDSCRRSTSTTSTCPGKTYRVQAQAPPQFRQTPTDIGKLYVRGANNTMVPVSALTTTSFRSAPTVVPRFNGFTSAQFTGPPKAGHSTGELLHAGRRADRDPVRVGGARRFATRASRIQERASSGDAALVFALGLILVFLVLAAQYESWSVPFAVLFGVPFGVLGALLGIWIRGSRTTSTSRSGLITVVGLAAKNAILIVEFANELRAHGMSIRQAAVEAARERLRPILMTSFAFILGVLPLMLASGAGAVSRHSIGTGVFAGMLFATTIGIFFIPLFFRIIRGLAEGRVAP